MEAVIPYGSGPVAQEAGAASRTRIDGRPVARRWLWFWSAVLTAMYAALWSPYWYPLSDSSLYMSLGRSEALGRGMTMMGDPVRLVPPLTPKFLGLLMSMGGGIGVIQAVMTALMLASFVLSFLTLRRWTRSERLALVATVAAALSYWVFANAFTVMSEPLCVVLMWGGFLALSHVSPGSRWRWGLVLLAAALLLLAAMNRDAILCLLPGPVLGALIGARRHGRWSRESFAWAAIFAVVFGGWFVYRYPPQTIVGFFFPKPPPPLATRALPSTRPTTGPATRRVVVVAPRTRAGAKGGGGAARGGESEDGDEPGGKLREGRYRGAWMQGVPRDLHMVTEPPMLGGRWVCEGLVMASVGAFESRNTGLRWAGYAVAVTAFGVAILGGLGLFLGGRFWLIGCDFRRASFGRRWRVLRGRGAWWVLGPALYFLVIWLQWGIRIKPRYMVPVAPVLFLLLWHGMTTVALWIGRLLKRGGWSPRRTARAVGVGLVGLVLVGNIFPWGVEVYVRHFAGRDFYDVTRRAAYAQLIDIGAYAQHLPANESIVLTVMAHRRIAYFLTGHRLEMDLLNVPDWTEWDRVMEANRRETFTGPMAFRKRFNAPQRRRRFLSAIPKDAHYIIAFAESPKKQPWPGWHLPIREADTQVDWWRLYRREADDTWTRVSVPRSREYVSHIPGAAK